MRPGKRERMERKQQLALRTIGNHNAAKDAVTVAPVSPLCKSHWRIEVSPHSKAPSMWNHKRTRASRVRIIQGE